MNRGFAGFGFIFIVCVLFCRSLAWLWLLSCYGTDLHGVSRNGYMKYFSSTFGMVPMLLLQVSVFWECNA